MIIIVVIALIVGILVGIPICFAISLAGFLAISISGAFPLFMMVQRFVSGINSFSLMAVPLFILGGALMGAGGISVRIVNFCNALLSWLRGGLAITSVGANMIFAGISGSGAAAISAVGGLTAPAMIDKGYSREYTAALVGGAGSLGPVIPPSVDMIVFASITGMSVSKMFLGGIVPGLYIGFLMMLLSFFYARRKNIDYGGKLQLMEVWRTFKDAIFALIMPLIIIGGIISGIFTATEAGAISCLYGTIVGVFVYKEMKLKELIPAIRVAVENTAQVMMVIGASTVFGYIFAVDGVDKLIADWILHTTNNPTIIMMMTAGLMILIGMFMESLAAMPIVLPIVYPLLQSLGCNMNQFGVMFCLCTVMGGLTPPVGIYLFLSASITKSKVQKVIPWMLVMIAIVISAILIATLWTPFTTFLPNLLG